MKKITFILLLLTATITTAQQLYVEGGKTMSSFNFKNSQGNTLANLQASAHSFMAIGYRNPVLFDKMYASLGASYAGYGAIGSTDAVGNFMEWDTNYLEVNVGADYEFYTYKNFTFYAKTALSLGFFLQGVQTFNNKVIDLKNSDLDKVSLDFRTGLGFSHPISENLSFYAQYVHGKTFDSASGNEKLRIKSNNVGFGLLIDISNKYY
jgi:hypothetical protein